MPKSRKISTNKSTERVLVRSFCDLPRTQHNFFSFSHCRFTQQQPAEHIHKKTTRVRTSTYICFTVTVKKDIKRNFLASSLWSDFRDRYLPQVRVSDRVRFVHARWCRLRAWVCSDAPSALRFRSDCPRSWRFASRCEWDVSSRVPADTPRLSPAEKTGYAISCCPWFHVLLWSSFFHCRPMSKHIQHSTDCSFLPEFDFPLWPWTWSHVICSFPIAKREQSLLPPAVSCWTFWLIGSIYRWRGRLSTKI